MYLTNVDAASRLSLPGALKFTYPALYVLPHHVSNPATLSTWAINRPRAAVAQAARPFIFKLILPFGVVDPLIRSHLCDFVICKKRYMDQDRGKQELLPRSD
jgi:hypothetical protein